VQAPRSFLLKRRRGETTVAEDAAARRCARITAADAEAVKKARMEEQARATRRRTPGSTLRGGRRGKRRARECGSVRRGNKTSAP